MKNAFFTNTGGNSDAIAAELTSFKSADIPWETGKVFAYVYEPSAEAYALIKKAYMLFLTENGLDPTAFKSLLNMEREVIDIALQLVGGTDAGGGNFTFGGTESIILAVKTARDYAREKYPEILRPNIVLPVTAHAAFFKACHYLCVDLKVVPVDETTFLPNLKEYENTIDENTILCVCSTPSYAHGVMDPVEEIAAMAKKRNLLCHVDACVGGMYLPFAQSLGYPVPKFGFDVEGVTSLSMDFHKYGYTAKGASCILYKDRDLRKYQIYTCSQWSGYSVVNPTVMSSKSGGSLAACWANMQLLGHGGYSDIVRSTQEASIKVQNWVKQHPEYQLLGNPVMNLVAFASNSIDLFELTSRMGKRGWYIQLQFQHGVSPTNIHLSINRANVEHVDALISDLNSVTQELVENPVDGTLPFPQEFIDGLTPEMVNELKSGLGVGDGEAPEDLTLVNRILNAASPDTRDMILKEFVNGLFR